MTTELRARLFTFAIILSIGTPSASFAQQGPAAASDNTARRADASESGEQQSYESLSADKLFLEGRALIRQGKPQDACRMLERSHKLAPTLATLLNLGLCHRFSGHLATAHDYYRQAEVKATLDGDAKRRDFAHEEAAALSSQRASLTLRVSGTPDSPLEVRIDDVLQPREVWERPMFIDAGQHRISVRAAGQLIWEGQVQVVDGNKHVVVIPEWPPKAAAEVAPSTVAAPSETAELPPPPSEPLAEPAGLSTTRVVAVSVAGAGLAALGVSLVYTILASNSYAASNDSGYCRTEKNVCNAAGLELRDKAQAQATVATAFGISGAAALAGGVALWFLSAPKAEERSATNFSIQADPHVIAGRWTASFQGL